jgi:hypothetical protein
VLTQRSVIITLRCAVSIMPSTSDVADAGAESVLGTAREKTACVAVASQSLQVLSPPPSPRASAPSTAAAAAAGGRSSATTSSASEAARQLKPTRSTLALTTVLPARASATLQLPPALVPTCRCDTLRVEYALHFASKQAFRSTDSVMLPIKIVQRRAM